jgi:hypothetical protein
MCWRMCENNGVWDRSDEGPLCLSMCENVLAAFKHLHGPGRLCQCQGDVGRR